MSKFKIGQRVVAIGDHSLGKFKRGDEFIVDGFGCCSKCGRVCLMLYGLNEIYDVKCSTCKHVDQGIRQQYAEDSFAPLQSFGELITEQIVKEFETNKKIAEEQFIILSGEGDSATEHQFVAAGLSEAEMNAFFDELKAGAYASTHLYVFRGRMVREE